MTRALRRADSADRHVSSHDDRWWRRIQNEGPQRASPIL